MITDVASVRVGHWTTREPAPIAPSSCFPRPLPPVGKALTARSGAVQDNGCWVPSGALGRLLPLVGLRSYQGDRDPREPSPYMVPQELPTAQVGAQADLDKRGRWLLDEAERDAQLPSWDQPYGCHVTRAEAVEVVAAHGWTVARVTERGYLIMRCACGNHQETLHKTPSNPNHFRQKAGRMIASCSRQVP